MEENEDGGERVARLVPYEGHGLDVEGETEPVEEPKKAQKTWFEYATSEDEGEDATAADTRRPGGNGSGITRKVVAVYSKFCCSAARGPFLQCSVKPVGTAKKT